ncbi:FAD-binding oxidoreductase [Marivibrio halodurans]|uniref:FAD-binding oxidoreductase n=1 Tax=Marivibrio halodurans TaxID=2039722 RepID=A0A8J7V063_9PROT|nr:FAD-binding oxidoreductase [Marivibrio halodurans]MBP5856441.1 FAD-binding oxidoreductase [Marivibrio halodurans]
MSRDSVIDTRTGDAPPTASSPDAAAVERAVGEIRAALDDKGWVTDPAALDSWLVDSRGIYHGKCLGMARPASTAEVAAVMRIAYEAGIPVVPQGGNTGRVGGSTPDGSGRMLLINLSRMNKVRAIDAANDTMTVEAGCILKSLQDEAAAADRLFPLSLGAEGTCQIGGNLASNAGGINVVRYGNARELVLGLEVVLPDGRVWDGLTGLRKNNTGYDMKHLFLGSEGTLGIITGAVLKLFPRPRTRATALVALSDLDAALTLLADAKAKGGGALTSFELMPGFALDWAEKLVEGARAPFEQTYDWTVLLEFAGGEAVEAALQTLLEEAFEAERIVDAVIAQSEDQRGQLWFLREAIVDAQNREGAQIKHDISVPVSAIPDFIRRAAEAVERVQPGTRPYPFGHVGDGNIHYNLSQPEDMDGETFKARAPDLHRAVHDIVHDLKGSISAEHGIGRSKRDELTRYKSAVELDIMRQVKRALDPKGLMNPGALLPEA